MNLANVYWQCKRGLPLDQSYDCGGDVQRVIKEFPLRYFGRGRVITWTKQEWLSALDLVSLVTGNYMFIGRLYCRAMFVSWNAIWRYRDYKLYTLPSSTWLYGKYSGWFTPVWVQKPSNPKLSAVSTISHNQTLAGFHLVETVDWLV